MPLVDVYQLDYFPVIRATGDTPQDRQEAWVNFYLYNDSERTIRTTVLGAQAAIVVDVEPRDLTPFRVQFKDMLELYKVQYVDTTTLDELENNFWTAFFDPNGLNDRFDADQYCHSPWFEKCCGEQRSVSELKARGDWEHLWLKWRARKTINFPAPPPTEKLVPNQAPGVAPTNLEIVHFDWNQLGVALIAPPVYVPTLDANKTPVLNDQGPKQDPSELKVMLLLKA
jgi:hypothetical protein